MAERRSNPRYQPKKETFGRVKTTLQARILDISSGGVQIELPAALRPLAECDVAVPVTSGELRLRARVRRCRAAVSGSGGKEDGGMTFRAGLEFVGLNDEQRRQLLECYGPEPSTPKKKPSQSVEETLAALEPKKRKKKKHTEEPAAKPTRPKGPIKIRINTEHIRDRVNDD